MNIPIDRTPPAVWVIMTVSSDVLEPRRRIAAMVPNVMLHAPMEH
jgi:hypothetical protein